LYSWEELEKACLSCRGCKLCTTRKNVVVGTGNKQSDMMFVGEGPGEQEDLQGLPFVGPAGQLLDKMLSAINLSRNDIYITNVVKCRPPLNRDPESDEKKVCLNYLRHQYLLIRPKIIVCLGRIAAQAIIEPDFKITRNRGLWYKKKNCDIIATYHPSAILRDESKKYPAWEDFKSIKQKYDEVRNIKQ